MMLNCGMIYHMLRMTVISVLGVVLSGCSLLSLESLGFKSGNSSSVPSIIKIDVPEIKIIFGWADGGWWITDANVLSIGVLLFVGVGAYFVYRRSDLLRKNDRSKNHS